MKEPSSFEIEEQQASSSSMYEAIRVAWVRSFIGQDVCVLSSRLPGPESDQTIETDLAAGENAHHFSIADKALALALEEVSNHRVDRVLCILEMGEAPSIGRTISLTDVAFDPEGIGLRHERSVLLSQPDGLTVCWMSSWSQDESSHEFGVMLRIALQLATKTLGESGSAWMRAATTARDIERDRALSDSHAGLATTVSVESDESGALPASPDGEDDESHPGLGVKELNTVLRRAGQPVDVGLVSPVGYRRVVEGRLGVVGSLSADRMGVEQIAGLIDSWSDGPGVDIFGRVRGVKLPKDVRVLSAGFETGLVDHLRGYAGVADHPAFHETAAERAETLVGLATAGVPVSAVDIDDETESLIGDDMSTVLTTATVDDLLDPETRDQLSVKLRRLGLSGATRVTKWREIAGTLGLTVGPLPKVSVILATNRPEFVEHSIRQVHRQTYPNLELVLILHGTGFTQTDSQLATAYDRPLTVIRVPSNVVFGEALNRGVAVSTGSLIAKIDDDDWYATQHIWDLVHAMDYSGAELIGKAAEFVYLEEINITIRRMVNGSETYGNRNLAGGTFLIQRTTLNHIGGWRRI
ncbi:MAG: glycosyltransferase, partial [Acidimicrobiia bacterium]